MPPYMRFPETEAIQQKLWGFRPRNPTCGLISLETGTKFYTSTNFVSTQITLKYIFREKRYYCD